jgi:steroid delta-isomerase-like uncharacterized protein
MSKQECEQLATDFVASWGVMDAAVTAAFVAEGGAWIDVSVPEPMRDRAAMAQYVQGWNTAMPDLNARLVHCVATDDEVAAEVEFTATNTGPMQMGAGPTMPPTGKPILGKGTFFGRVKDGKFEEVRTYPDVAGVMMQLGVMAPAG